MDATTIVNFSVYVITFALMLVCAAVSFCRIAAIDMRGVQYRYVAPNVLAFVGSLGVGLALLAGEKMPWYQPLFMLAVALKMWNSRREWDAGMPEHFRRAQRIGRSSFPARVRKNIARENLAVVFVTILAVSAAGAGSASGHPNQARIHVVAKGR